jgi:hypothetical protein
MISWTITVPPTVGTASYTASARNESGGAAFAIELTEPPGGGPLETYNYGTADTFREFYSLEAETLGNANTVNRRTNTGFVQYVNDPGDDELGFNESSNYTNVSVTISSWDGNVIENDNEGISPSTSTYEQQTTTVGTASIVAYDPTSTTTATTTGALTTVESSVFPTTRTTTISAESFQSKTVSVATIQTTTTQSTILAYNGNTGQRLIATVIIPENERIYVPDAIAPVDSENVSLDFGPLARVASQGGIGENGEITITPQLITKPAMPDDITIGNATTVTDEWIFRPTFATAIATQVATNPFLYPSPVEEVSSASRITTLSNQDYTLSSQTTVLETEYLIPVCVSTVKTIQANLLGQQFVSTVYSTTVSNFVKAQNQSGSESGSGSFFEGEQFGEPGFASSSGSSESAYGLTTCLFGYQELGNVPNQGQRVYAKSFLAGRASPAELSAPALNLQAAGMTLTVPATVLANQTVYLPRPMTSWSSSNSEASTTFTLDAEGATAITAFSNGSTSSQSGEWTAQGQAATNCNVAGNQQINPGGAAATGQITAIYGPGWYATTNENGVSGVQSYPRVFAELQSVSGRLARSSVEQFLASVRYGQGQVVAAYFTTATRNPTTHIVGNELVI